MALPPFKIPGGGDFRYNKNSKAALDIINNVFKKPLLCTGYDPESKTPCNFQIKDANGWRSHWSKLKNAGDQRHQGDKHDINTYILMKYGTLYKDWLEEHKSKIIEEEIRKELKQIDNYIKDLDRKIEAVEAVEKEKRRKEQPLWRRKFDQNGEQMEDDLDC